MKNKQLRDGKPPRADGALTFENNSALAYFLFDLLSAGLPSSGRGFDTEPRQISFPFRRYVEPCRPAAERKTPENSHRITSQPNNVYLYPGESFSYLQEFPKQDKSERLSTALEKMELKRRRPGRVKTGIKLLRLTLHLHVRG